MNQYLNEVIDTLKSVNLSLLESAISLIDETRRNQRNIFVIGNGGSASLASHFTTDLLKSAKDMEVPISVFSLVDNSSLITATSNDFSFDEVFSWQLKQLAKPGDLLIAISSSGNSSNIVEAIRCSRKIGVKTITLSGFEGGRVSQISDIPIVTRSLIGNYGPVEDSHSILCHFIAKSLKML